MLPANLNTNEVKDAAGTEVEFTHQSEQGRKRVFQKIGELYAYPQHIIIQHDEKGVGVKKVRRSNLSIQITELSGVDSLTPITPFISLTLSLPVGLMATNATAARLCAYMGSFGWLTGADSTLKYDGSGTGIAALLAGTQ